MSKKLPPLRGGGEVTDAADGGDFAGTEVGKLNPVNEEEDDCAGGDLDWLVLGKLNPVSEEEDGGAGGGLLLGKLKPPNASVSPPKASGFVVVEGEVMPPNDGCRP